MKVTTAPGSSVMQEDVGVGLACRSTAIAFEGVMAAMRTEPRSGQNRPEPTRAEMRRDDQAVELLVGGVGEREHGPVLAASSLASTSMRRTMPSAPGGGNLEVLALIPVDLDRARERLSATSSREILIGSTAKACDTAQTLATMETMSANNGASRKCFDKFRPSW
jgi:hypothetical protein